MPLAIFSHTHHLHPTRVPPLPNSYTLSNPRLHAGEYPGHAEEGAARRRIATLIDAGVNTFIDLTTPHDRLRPYEPLLPEAANGRTIERHAFPIPDLGITSDAGIRRILDEIDTALAAGREVYVHCWGGVGRTGMIVGCWLVRHGHAGAQALETVAALFATMTPAKTSRHPRGSPETDAQRAVVARWETVEQRPTVRRDSADLPLPADAALGCLLGGAVGDALGAPVEFLNWSQIRARFGPSGIQEFAPAYGRLGAITDDTQMTLWTAEGVLRGMARAAARGVGGPMSVLPRSYLRWLYTQDGSLPAHVEHPALVLGDEETSPGWLLGVPALHAHRAPGNTCLSALRDPNASLWERARNDSKGCGGVMRVSPIAFIDGADSDQLFALACDAAAITHGHPTGILSSGALVWLLLQLKRGLTLSDAVHATIARVGQEPDHEETTQAMQRALTLARSVHPPSVDAVESLGGGWTGETALAIGVYAALVAGDDFARGVRMAVNHSGDSDSTGSIAGQLLGIQLGRDAIPTHWLHQLELRDEIALVAADLVNGTQQLDPDRYPGF